LISIYPFAVERVGHQQFIGVLRYRDLASPFDAFGIAGLAGAAIGLVRVQSDRTLLVALAVAFLAGLLLFVPGMRTARLTDHGRHASIQKIVSHQLSAALLLLAAVVFMMLVGYETDRRLSNHLDLAALGGGGLSGLYLALFLTYLASRLRR
jgi:hypothetical protein